MMLNELITYVVNVVTDPSVVLFGTLTIIEFTPIKLNPLKWLGKKIGNLINGELIKDLHELKRDFEETKAQDKRWFILNFANSCRRGECHSREEWKHAISEIREYEKYTEEKEIVNGVIEEDSKYLRELYHERNLKNDFL